MNPFTKFIISLGGYSPHVTELNPHAEQTKIIASALCIFIPVIIGGVGAGLSVYMLNESWHQAIVTGLVWAVIILLLDRSLVAGFKKSSSEIPWLYALPRIGLAFLASLVFAHAFLLIIFSGDLDRQNDEIKRKEILQIQNDAENKIKNLTYSTQSEKTKLTNQIGQMSREIDSISRSIRETQRELYRGNAIVKAEADRGGYGTQAKLKTATFVTPFVEQLKAQQSHLASLQSSRSNAMRSLHEPSTHIHNVQATQAYLVRTVADSKRTDIMSRYRALHQIIKDDETARYATWAICLLLLLLELSPLITKMLAGESPYTERKALEERNHSLDCQNLEVSYIPLSAESQLRIAQSNSYTNTIASVLHNQNEINNIKSKKVRHAEPERFFTEKIEALTGNESHGTNADPYSDYQPSNSNGSHHSHAV